MTGVDLIAAERKRQIEVEGWTPEHDDKYDAGELAWAAVCYAAPGRVFRAGAWLGQNGAYTFVDPWPFHESWDKRLLAGSNNVFDDRAEAAEAGRPDPETYYYEEQMGMLIMAGALIAGEIDRMRRVWKAVQLDEALPKAEEARDILSLVGVEVSVDDILLWTTPQYHSAVDWASRMHLAASDNDDVEVPVMPEFLVDLEGDE